MNQNYKEAGLFLLAVLALKKVWFRRITRPLALDQLKKNLEN